MRKFFKVIGFLILCILLLALFNRQKIKQLLIVNTFFEPDKIVSNFQDIEEIFPHTTIPPSSNKLRLPERLGFSFPTSFDHNNKEHQTKVFLEETHTEGLLVILKDTIVFEGYYLGLEKDEKHISWSMAKSFIGTLIGIAVEQGKLKLTDKVEDHLEEFKGTGYEGVTVENLLCMRSGVRFNEDYGDFNSDINRFGRAFALGSSYRDFAKTLTNEVEPGSVCHYVSMDTQVLGFLLSKVMGKSITELLKEYIWNPVGMEHEGGWIIDNTGEELGMGGLTATLRDYSKLGLLYLHMGNLNGHQIVDSTWIKRATSRHPSADTENSTLGYGYQWWIPYNDTGDFMAAGIYDQFIYVNPEKELIITKLSADHRFRNNGPAIRDKHISFFQEVARQLP